MGIFGDHGHARRGFGAKRACSRGLGSIPAEFMFKKFMFKKSIFKKFMFKKFMFKKFTRRFGREEKKPT